MSMQLNELAYGDIHVGALLPLIILVATLLINIILPVVIKATHVGKISFLMTLLGLTATLLQTKPPTQAVMTIWPHLLQQTHWIAIIQLLSVAITLLIVVVMYAEHNLHPARLNLSFIFMLVLLMGAYLLPACQHWLMVYTSVTFMSIATTMLMYIHTGHKRGILASQKYLLYSSTIASGFMLFGISYVYGYSGSLDIVQGLIASAKAVVGPAIVPQVSVLFALLGLLMLLGSFPYQFWIADIYTALPCSLVAYLSTITKVAVVGFLVNVGYTIYVIEGSTEILMFRNLLAIIAVVTMAIGHMAAFTTQHIGKLLAYGGIAQTGALLALVVTDLSSYSHIIYYLIVYTLMNITSWLSLDALYKNINGFHLSDYEGVGKRFPIVSLCITVAILALIGLPPTSGFIAKFVLWNKLCESIQQAPSVCIPILWLTSVLGTMISLYYYLRIPYTLFNKLPKQARTLPVGRFSFVHCILIVLTCLLIGLVVV